MLGISIYFQDLDYDYLEKASKLGAKYLFTSLHIPEEDLSNLDNELPKFLKRVNDLGYILIPDISPGTFNKLGVENNDYKSLKKLGFKSLRLDYGIEDFSLIRDLQKDFHLILNASTMNKQYLLDAKEHGVDLSNISLMHNFYPKTDTGLSEEHFVSMNEDFLELDLPVMAFVVSDKLKRFPLYEGLPTLEKHRHVNPYVASVELIKKFGVKDVVIGDSITSINSLEWISDYIDNNIINIPAYLTNENKEYYNKVYTVRRDPSDNVVRIGTPRIPDIEILNNNNRQRGTITIENKLAGRYSGEINIHKKDAKTSSRSNVMGFVHPDYVSLVDYMSNVKIRFVKI